MVYIYWRTRERWARLYDKRRMQARVDVEERKISSIRLTSVKSQIGFFDASALFAVRFCPSFTFPQYYFPASSRTDPATCSRSRSRNTRTISWTCRRFRDSGRLITSAYTFSLNVNHPFEVTHCDLASTRIASSRRWESRNQTQISATVLASRFARQDIPRTVLHRGNEGKLKSKGPPAPTLVVLHPFWSLYRTRFAIQIDLFMSFGISRDSIYIRRSIDIAFLDK